MPFLKDSEFGRLVSLVAPHRLEEASRPIDIIESYIDGRLTSKEAISFLGLSEPSFWVLLRTWRRARRPEALVGSGRKGKPRFPVTAEQRRLLAEAEAALPRGALTEVIARARRLALEGGEKLPGTRNMKLVIEELRRHRGLRPSGVVDVLVSHCAVNIPVRHESGDLVAPVMSLVLEVGETATVVGAALSLAGPSPASTASAIIDALTSADTPVRALNEVRLLLGSCEEWVKLRESFDQTGRAVAAEPIKPRSAREVSRLISNQPGGLRLKPDLTATPPSRRVVHLPPDGTRSASMTLSDWSGHG